MIKFDATKLAAVSIAQSDEATRYYLCGVYFEGSLAVATDGHILTVANDESQANESGIYPVSKKARTVMKKKEASLVTIEGDVLKVLTDNETVLHMEPCKEIDGSFPDWRRVVPDNDGDPTTAAFSTIVTAKLVETAKTVTGLKTTSFRMTGTEATTGHLVTYNHSDCLSVAMPMKGNNTPVIPAWLAPASV